MLDNQERRKDHDRAYLAAGLTAYALGLRVEDILAPGRGSPGISFGRHVAMYLSHVALGMSLARVARAFDRDRSTVAHGCHSVEDRRDDQDFDAWMEQLEDGLRSVVPLHGVRAA